ncbi:hypothetical protein [Mariniblastus fucicola]|uniref:Uncharacterized protein n=1 Tax=Mariniblastus fucicola TaxID=980251 RepID=A0A5B9PCR8_9BACT|nr:hypothetical protein [Mariniblastus fucicola]QEG20891.1 hypothetical protein MFFC18_07420 [Mariniblastus fucicola]
MPAQASIPFDFDVIRQIAARKLRHYSKDSGPIRECYLFKGDFLAGVKFELGAICLQWNSPESHGSILRGDLLLESVSIAPHDEQRRAA